MPNKIFFSRAAYYMLAKPRIFVEILSPSATFRDSECYLKLLYARALRLSTGVFVVMGFGVS